MRLVIFDCDGTIVDSQHAIVTAMEQAFGAAGMEAPARERVLDVVGLSLIEAVGRLVPGAKRDLVASLADRYKLAFAELRARPEHHEPLFPGAREAIVSLAERDDVVLGIATGKSRRGVVALFDREGLHPYFATVQTADTHPSKPHPSMIEQAMAEAGVGREATVMVGDTTYDIEMARAAGVGAVAVSWGYHPAASLAGAGAHVIIDRYAELPPAIDRLWPAEEQAG